MAESALSLTKNTKNQLKIHSISLLYIFKSLALFSMFAQIFTNENGLHFISACHFHLVLLFLSLSLLRAFQIHCHPHSKCKAHKRFSSLFITGNRELLRYADAADSCICSLSLSFSNHTHDYCFIMAISEMRTLFIHRYNQFSLQLFNAVKANKLASKWIWSTSIVIVKSVTANLLYGIVCVYHLRLTRKLSPRSFCVNV